MSFEPEEIIAFLSILSEMSGSNTPERLFLHYSFNMGLECRELTKKTVLKLNKSIKNKFAELPFKKELDQAEEIEKTNTANIDAINDLFSSQLGIIEKYTNEKMNLVYATEKNFFPAIFKHSL